MIVTREDPYGSRLVGMIYGRQKVGKTTAALSLLQNDCRLIYFCYDRGVYPAMRQMGLQGVEKRLIVFYPGIKADGTRSDDVVKETKLELEQAREKVLGLLKKGLDQKLIWIIFDTWNHFQTRALSEARRISIGHQHASRLEKEVRDAITQVDYNVNLGQMRDVLDIALSIPANILFICHEKVDRELRDKPRAHPNIIGQTYTAVIGDVDYCFRMVVEADQKRYFHTLPTDDEEAGYRLGKLEPIEEADLWKVYTKMIAVGS